MGLTRLSIRRPIVLLMALAAILVLGWKARLGMPAELDPRVELPIVNVMAVYPGAGPEEVERSVTRPLEDAVATAGNVVSVSSRTLENVAFITVELRLGTDVTSAANEVRARVEAVRRSLPAAMEPPEIARFDFNARPVMVLAVTGDRPLDRLGHLVEEEIRPRLSEVPGLGSVTVLGARGREVRVEVDPLRLEGTGLSLLDLLRPLAAASQSAPAGSLVEGAQDTPVRVLGEFRSLDDLQDTVLPAPSAFPVGSGQFRGPDSPPVAPLRLRDIATVREALAEQTQITRVGGRESIGLVLARMSDANTVRVAEGVREALAALQLPGDVHISVLQDNSVAVGDALEDINVTLILGAFLAIAVVFLFLQSAKDTLIVACSIPTSIIATFLVMGWAGFSLNQMTMLALSLCVGILVDDSILVLECIHRHRAQGKSPEQAALEGRAEIGLADAANTFVDVVVFLPIAFMGGVVGQFFREFGLTIATASLASLYISFSLTPMLAARWYRRSEAAAPAPRGWARAFNYAYGVLEERYRQALGWALQRRGAVVVLGYGALAAVGILAWQFLGFDFTPSVDRGQVNVQLELPPGSSLQATSEVTRRAEEAAASIPEVDRNRMLASVGEIIGGFGSIPDRGPQFAQVTLNLRDKPSFLQRLLSPAGVPGKRMRSDEEVAQELRGRLEPLQREARITVNAARGLTAALAPISLSLNGNDPAQLEQASVAVTRALSALPELRDVESTLRRGRPELRLEVDRSRLADAPATPGELVGALRTAIAGNTDLVYRDGDEAVPIRVRIAREGAAGGNLRAEDLRELVVAQRGPVLVRVGDIAEVGEGAGPTRILRAHRIRRALVTAQVAEGISLGAAQAAVERALSGLELGSIRWAWQGDVDDMRESAVHMATALLLAIALAYMLLAALFNNLLQPLTLMSSLPMALVGGLLALLATRMTLNIVSMVGIIMLVGLVSKNAILLVDYTNTLRTRGLDRTAALQAAGPVRLRPILMTTISTVLAMTPVALQIGRASEMRSPMAVVVIGGLLLSTLLTLLVIPAMYSWFDDLGELIVRHWRRARGPDQLAGAREGMPGDPSPVGTEDRVRAAPGRLPTSARDG